MTTTRRSWTTAELAALAVCGDCDADVTIDEVEPDVFTAVVSHDDSCPWFRAFVRGGADQSLPPFAFAPPTSDVILDLTTAPRVAF